MKNKGRDHMFRDSTEDAAAASRLPDTDQTRAPTYRLAFADPDFLTAKELRPVRLQLELLKPQIIMRDLGVEKTVVMFGGSRIPAPEHRNKAGTSALAHLSHYYTEAQKFACRMTKRSLETGGRRWVIVTGGGPGVMEAGNRGAAEAGGRSVGLSIVLPHEQAPNEYITPELCFNFHYFAIRKMHFLMRASAICVFPGGFGTMDELFESLTLIQTERMRSIPFLLFGREWWQNVINWHMLANSGVISPEDLKLFRMVETAEEALAVIDNWRDPALGTFTNGQNEGDFLDD